tara:strand:- start:5900 stop:6295 length:396 start_codon:yes stop_codon:yes gene_type:complete
MPRKTKQKVKVNNVASLEGVLQEVYNEACGNIRDAQGIINELNNGTVPEDVDDFAKIAKAKTDAIKEKTVNIKVKLEIAKLQNDSVKHAGDMQATLHKISDGEVTTDDFTAVRRLIKEKAAQDAAEKETDE